MSIAVLLAAALVVVVLALWWASKRRYVRLLGRVTGYVSFIQIAVYQKLSKEYGTLYGDQRGKLLAAAVTNRLFAKPPQHEPGLLQLAEELSSEVVRSDDEVSYAALMSLRTLAHINTAAGDMEAVRRVGDTVQWMEPFWLPPDAPDALHGDVIEALKTGQGFPNYQDDAPQAHALRRATAWHSRPEPQLMKELATALMAKYGDH